MVVCQLRDKNHAGGGRVERLGYPGEMRRTGAVQFVCDKKELNSLFEEHFMLKNRRTDNLTDTRKPEENMI